MFLSLKIGHDNASCRGNQEIEGILGVMTSGDFRRLSLLINVYSHIHRSSSLGGRAMHVDLSSKILSLYSQGQLTSCLCYIII